MGKGFNNYMCKKFFHPASRDNLKRVWMAEQKADAYKKKQEELKTQYDKEQDLYTNKAMLSKDSKDKLSVNFMYEPPPGAKKEREREDNEPEYKFEWQRKYNAPRESYCKGDSEIRDQPFGIQVRNVRCIKCHKWGHINTDKECPMFKDGANENLGLDPMNKPADDQPDPLTLVKQMREDGLHLKTSALALQHHVDMPGSRTMLPEIPSDEDILKKLTTKQKLRLLKKLKKLDKQVRTKNKQRMRKGSKKNGEKESETEDESWIESKKLKITNRSNNDCGKKRKDKREKKPRSENQSDYSTGEKMRSKSDKEKKDNSEGEEKRRDRKERPRRRDSGEEERRRDRKERHRKDDSCEEERRRDRRERH